MAEAVGRVMPLRSLSSASLMAVTGNHEACLNQIFVRTSVLDKRFFLSKKARRPFRELFWEKL